MSILICLFNKHTAITMLLDNGNSFKKEHRVVLGTLVRVLLTAAVTTIFDSVVDEGMQVNIMHSVSKETRDTARVAFPLIVSLVGPSNVASISIVQKFINYYLFGMYSIFYIQLFGYNVKHLFVVLTHFYNIAQGMSSTAQVAIIYTIHCANIRALT